jgi:carboxyl-terminal processing protease
VLVRTPRLPRPSQLAVVLVPLLVLFLSFGSGYLVGQLDALSGRRPLPQMLHGAGLGFLADRIPDATYGEAGLSQQDRERFRAFWEAWNWVNREFYQPERVDHQAMVYGAVRGMLQTLDDPYTVFLDPRHGEIADSDLRGSFGGIGVQVDVRDGALTIVAPLDGSPGAQAGLKPDDIITRVDGKDVTGIGLSEAVLLIRGPRGSTVTLTIRRVGIATDFDVPVTRGDIKVDSVKSRMLDGGVGYLRISSFSSTTGTETEQALKSLLAQNPRGLILDLRSNPGG